MPSRHSLVIASGVWPHVAANREAANVISHEITAHLARAGRFDVRYAYVNSVASDLPAAAKPELEALSHLGVRFLEPVIVDPKPIGAESLFTRAVTLLRGRPERLLTGTDRTEALLAAMDGEPPDAVLTIWAETASNLVAGIDGSLKVTYAGNPDHKVLDARLDLSERLGQLSAVERLRNRVRRQAVKAGHLKVMSRFDLMWNVAANDAADYRAAGVNARYLQNMWPAAVRTDWDAERDRHEQTRPLKIIGNVGNLSATGNSYGLLTLSRQILPELKTLLGAGGFEIHLFGGGMPHPAVARHLEDRHIRLRGFVDDLDAEILSAPIFLVANNSQRFKVGHTRFLHAWSLGAAVVGFADSAEAMPEIVDGENALLGATPAGVARHIAQLAVNPARRRALGRAGEATVTGSFAPSRVTGQILADIETLLSERRRGGAS